MTEKRPKRISLRIRKIYYDQIVAGTKVVELRKDSEFWRKRLICDPPPEIAVFVCGKRVHRRRITHITIGDPEDILERSLSAQGKKDVPGDKCYAIWLGGEIKIISCEIVCSHEKSCNITECRHRKDCFYANNPTMAEWDEDSLWYWPSTCLDVSVHPIKLTCHDCEIEDIGEVTTNE